MLPAFRRRRSPFNRENTGNPPSPSPKDGNAIFLKCSFFFFFGAPGVKNKLRGRAGTALLKLDCKGFALFTRSVRGGGGFYNLSCYFLSVCITFLGGLIIENCLLLCTKEAHIKGTITIFFSLSGSSRDLLFLLVLKESLVHTKRCKNTS